MLKEFFILKDNALCFGYNKGTYRTILIYAEGCGLGDWKYACQMNTRRV